MVKKLSQDLRLLDIVALATGAMISSGLFVLPGLAFAEVGPAVILSYFLASILVLPAMLAQAELASAIPKSGGTYVFIERSLGPLAGTFAGFLNWISIALKAAFALIGLGALVYQIAPQLGEWSIKASAILGCIFFAWLNILGTKGVGKLQALLVGLLVIILLGYGVALSPNVEGQKLFPFFQSNFHQVLAVAGMVFVSFGGLTKVASVGEEVSSPGRSLPLGMVLSWLLVTLLYVFAVFVTVGVLPANDLAGSLAPLSLAAERNFGPVGVFIIDAAAALAFVTTANAGILSASRAPMAMSRDGLLPDVLSKTSQKANTPYYSIILTSAFMVLVIAVLSLEDLVKTASAIMILLFIFLNIAVLILRYSQFESYQPPFRMPWIPVMPAVAIALYSVLLIEMGSVALLLTGAFAVLSIIWFGLYVRPRISRESAFVHLVKRLTAKPLRRINFEDELRQISIEREAPEISEFLKQVESCPVLDIEEELEASEMYRRVARTLDPFHPLTEDELYKLFLERERESSTVIESEISVIQVILDQPGANVMLLVRAKQGVWFSRLHKPVKAAFVFVGSSDQRNFHLRAGMKLAHVIGASDFLTRWMNARDDNELRDVILVKPG